jgi:isopentenyl-diphosphate delta-isomerase
MKNRPNLSLSDELAERKEAHIDLAMKAQTPVSQLDTRFDYEPLFFTHPDSTEKWPTTFLKHNLDYPLWISSMTGGTAHAQKINQNLARLCGEFKLGMGLGSCRGLLNSNDRLSEFNVRLFLGDQPLFANLGIAQVEELVLDKKEHIIHEMVKKIEASGLIIHLNPLQEWFQPEGDRYKISPLITLTRFLDKSNYPVIVKEVGQGMGPRSLKALLDLPIKGIELGAFGGTNFTLLESMRGRELQNKMPFVNVGHTAFEMVQFLNAIPMRDQEFIISGGIKNVLDGFELKSTLKAPSVIGMASSFLAPAMESYEVLQNHFLSLRESLLTARGVLKVKGNQ